MLRPMRPAEPPPLALPCEGIYSNLQCNLNLLCVSCATPAGISSKSWPNKAPGGSDRSTERDRQRQKLEEPQRAKQSRGDSPPRSQAARRCHYAPAVRSQGSPASAPCLRKPGAAAGGSGSAVVVGAHAPKALPRRGTHLLPPTVCLSRAPAHAPRMPNDFCEPAEK